MSSRPVMLREVAASKICSKQKNEMDKQAFVYIVASRRHGTIYTGVSRDLIKRMYEHKTHTKPDSFTARYGVHILVWYLAGQDISAAIALEKKIKNRNRAWKIALIECTNPNWRDLSADFMDSATIARNDRCFDDCAE